MKALNGIESDFAVINIIEMVLRRDGSLVVV